VVDRLAVVGEPADCARAVWRLHEAEAVVLVPPPGAEIAIGQLERAAPDLLRLVSASSACGLDPPDRVCHVIT
jgi:hypothetical protein